MHFLKLTDITSETSLSLYWDLLGQYPAGILAVVFSSDPADTKIVGMQTENEKLREMNVRRSETQNDDSNF